MILNYADRLGLTPFPRTLAAALLLALAAGCGRPPAPAADLAVSIDGERLSYRVFEAYLHHQIGSEDPVMDSEVRSRLFDQFLDGQLLIRLAIERGLEIDPPPDAATTGDPGLPAAEPGLEERRAIAFLLRDGGDENALEEEVAAYYQEHGDEFRRPEEVTLRQILTYDEERAAAAAAALAQGEDFAQVAARLSQGPGAELGGDQGRLARHDLPQAFRDTIFALEAGEVSDVVTADYGYLIFQVVDRHGAETVPLAAAEEEIRQRLRRRHVDELLAGLLAEARARYNVRIFPHNFPFEYQGVYAK